MRYKPNSSDKQAQVRSKDAPRGINQSKGLIMNTNLSTSSKESSSARYLEETYPQHPLIPYDIAKRIVNNQAASIVTSSMQPLLRMPVQFYIKEKVGQDEKISWVHYYLGKCLAGSSPTLDESEIFAFVLDMIVLECVIDTLFYKTLALETLLKDHAGKYATGDDIMLVADVYLASFLIGYPQQHNFDMSEFPLLCRLGEAYIKVPTIENAIPEKQPDFPIN
nr:glutathione S-transferase zeta class-like [Tanacetum cinerariifolium]